MYSYMYLCERQLLRIGAALADTLLDDAHGEPLMRDALHRLAHVTVVG